jgi:hypothetical protein
MRSLFEFSLAFVAITLWIRRLHLRGQDIHSFQGVGCFGPGEIFWFINQQSIDANLETVQIHKRLCFSLLWAMLVG